MRLSPQYISSELFHFVGRSTPTDHARNYSVLKAVLACGCISHPPHEAGWGTVGYTLDLSKILSSEELIVPTVTCYCDIPYPLLGPHMSKYGNFGLSFSRHLLTKAGARPVIYVPCRPDDWRGVDTGHTFLKELEATFRGIHAQNKALTGRPSDAGEPVTLGKVPTSLEGAVRKAEHTLAIRVLAFVKPYESTLVESDPRYYYSEREWRKLGNVPFEQGDVERVIVDGSFLERARDELPSLSDRIFPSPSANAG